MRFEILAPRRPRIIAIHDLDQAGGPVHASATASIRHSELQFVLAQVQPAAEIHVYLDQVHCGKATHVRDCVYQFAISTVATPGDHDLAVRQIPTGAACSLASPLSDAVRVHYYRRDVYLRQGWRPPPPPATGTPSSPTPVTAPPSTSAALPPLPVPRPT
ncbi:MAG: hypothetical protein U0935_19860 [Pirellulales bacterium]